MTSKNNYSSTNDTNEPKGKAQWDSRLTELFIDACIVEVEAGNRPTSHFNKAGWNNLITNFNKASGKVYDRTQLKNKWDELKKKWKLWRQLKGKETGLGWDFSKQTIDAPSEWWEERLKEVPEAAKFRIRGLEFADKLDQLFMDVAATGDDAWSPSIGTLPSQNTQGKNPINLEDDNDDFDDQETQIQVGGNGSRKRHTDSQFRGGKEGKSHANGGARKSSNGKLMSQSINSLVEILKERSEERKMSKLMKNDPPGCSFAEVVKQLNSLSEIKPDSDLYYFALELFEDKNKREYFTALEIPTVKVGWLQRQQLKRGNSSFMSMMSNFDQGSFV